MKRAVIFAHFDAENEVKPYILEHLRALRDCCERMVFVSTSQLPEAQLQRLAPYTQEVILRDNEGMDFGMWRRGIEHCEADLESFDELVLTNSSVFGPLMPLPALFDRMATRSFDVWGCTDNHELAWHLQSYFLVFRKPALVHPAFKAFWSSVLPYRDKGQIVRSYELGLSTFLAESGLHLGAVVAVDDLIPEVVPLARRELARATGNTTASCPMALLERGMPFVKVELLRDNPWGIDLHPIYARMQEAGYNLAWVQFDR